MPSRPKLLENSLIRFWDLWKCRMYERETHWLSHPRSLFLVGSHLGRLIREYQLLHMYGTDVGHRFSPIDERRKFRLSIRAIFATHSPGSNRRKDMVNYRALTVVPARNIRKKAVYSQVIHERDLKRHDLSRWINLREVRFLVTKKRENEKIAKRK